jgi:hypothetical protein
MRQKLKKQFLGVFFGFWRGFSVLRNKNNNKKVNKKPTTRNQNLKKLIF